MCALRRSLRTVRLRTVLFATAVAAGLALNVSVALAAAYSAHLATQTLALTNAVARASTHRRDDKPQPPPPPVIQPAVAPPPPFVPAPPSPLEPSSCLALGISRRAHNEFAIDRVVIDHLLEHLAESMPFIRITPERGQNELGGIRLGQIPLSSPLSALGFQNGDVVWTINGFDMTNPERALEAYAKLRSSDELDVLVSQKGVLRIQRYHVR